MGKLGEVFGYGVDILNDAIETIKDAKEIIGGRFIILDAINNDSVITQTAS